MSVPEWIEVQKVLPKYAGLEKVSNPVPHLSGRGKNLYFLEQIADALQLDNIGAPSLIAAQCAMLHQGLGRTEHRQLTEAEYRQAFSLAKHHLQCLVETELAGRLDIDRIPPS